MLTSEHLTLALMYVIYYSYIAIPAAAAIAAIGLAINYVLE